MVIVLEALYVVTALTFLAAIVLLVRGRRQVARRFAVVGGICALFAIWLYWYLRLSS